MSTARYYEVDHDGQPRKPVPTITPAYVQLWSPSTVLATLVTFTEDSLWPFQTHYWQRRTRACMALVGPCEACERHQASRLTAYVSAVLRKSRQRVVFQVTAGALAGCPELLALDGQLSGRWVQARRRHDGPQSPVDVQLVAGRDPAIPAAPVDTCKVLAATWGYTPDLVERLIAPALTTGLDKRPWPSDNTPQ